MCSGWDASPFFPHKVPVLCALALPLQKQPRCAWALSPPPTACRRYSPGMGAGLMRCLSLWPLAASDLVDSKHSPYPPEGSGTSRVTTNERGQIPASRGWGTASTLAQRGAHLTSASRKPPW